MEGTLPWIEKYRPKVLDDVLGHGECIRTLRCFLKKGELPHILLHGPPGEARGSNDSTWTGKTSLVQALARALYGSNVRHMVLELNASDDRGIGVVRNQVKTFAESRPPMFFSSHEDSFTVDSPIIASEIHWQLRKLKLVVLDEVDQMTAAAQTALRRIMEKHAGHVRFFLMCNDVGKINPPIQSRCTKFRFAPLPTSTIEAKMNHVTKNEKIQLSDGAKSLLLKTANGDFRKLINTLQAAAMGCTGSVIDESKILNVLGLPSDEEIVEVFDILSTKSMKEAVRAVKMIIQLRGFSLADILSAVYQHSLTIDWPNNAALTLFPRMAEIESGLALGADEQILLVALISAFVEVQYVLQSTKSEYASISEVPKRAGLSMADS